LSNIEKPSGSPIDEKSMVGGECSGIVTIQQLDTKEKKAGCANK
jgi:hypothetical protein